MNIFVTGSAGFIGSSVVRLFRQAGYKVREFDLKTTARWADLEGSDAVIHLAALADVRQSLAQVDAQIQHNLLLTATLLDHMRHYGVNRIVFTSTAVVYGDCADGRITERATCFPQQTSVYGAMKLASESLLSAYCLGYGMQADILRMVSVVGSGYRHGNLVDFYRKLTADPDRLDILGSPTQAKYYVAVQDVVAAIQRVLETHHPGTAEIWNVSHDQPNTIQDSIEAVCEVLQMAPTIVTTATAWTGDLPGLVLDCTKLRNVGWAPQTSIRDAMRAAVEDFVVSGL